MCLLHYDYKGQYDIELEAWGKGVLSEKTASNSIDSILSGFEKKYGRAPADISLDIRDSLASGLDYGITGVDTEFLEKLETLKELILPDSITYIMMTPRLEEILKRNNTLIRGTFGSFAERFAREHSLNFRHSDIVIARHFYEAHYESTVVEMQFMRDGSVVLKETVNSPGSSAGNCLGGTFRRTLDGEFYKTMTAREIADMYSGSIYCAILEKGKLAEYINKAKTHKIFTGYNA